MNKKLAILILFGSLLNITFLTYNAWRDGQNLTFYFILWGVLIILFPTLIFYIRNKKNKESK